MGSIHKRSLTSPRLRGEVGSLRAMRSIVRSDPGEGTHRALLTLRIRGSSPSPQPSPRKSGARECTEFGR
jgi:hypothetical protein